MRSSTLATAAIAAAALAGIFPASALGQADLSVDLSDSADPVTTGAEYLYSAVVQNAGPEAANGVTLETTLPNEVDFVSATASQGTCDLQGARKVSCALGQVAAGGGTAAAEIRVRAQRDGKASATATVSGLTPADPNPANDSSTEETAIQSPQPVQCAGKAADIVGTAGDDVLTGTDRADVIVAFDGADTIVGLDGRDVVCAGTGDDVVKLGGAGDIGKGGGGNDRLRGSSGNDVLAGNSGDDSLGGGAGNDVLRGGAGTDRCGGGPGADVRRGCE
ncbi:MAG TPA: hypothetical protein VFY99_01195 [Solirubrobacterales bacterium]